MPLATRVLRVTRIPSGQENANARTAPVARNNVSWRSRMLWDTLAAFLSTASFAGLGARAWSVETSRTLSRMSSQLATAATMRQPCASVLMKL